MLALAFALSLAAAGDGDLDLPRSLSYDLDGSRFLAVEPAPAAAHDDFALWAGIHLGVAGAYDADDPCFVFGGGVRAHILSWLGAEVTVDFQTKQGVDHNAAKVFQVPFMFTGIFYPPIDFVVRPYGMFGFGWTITDVTVNVPGGKDTSDAEALFFLGFGAEYELSPSIMLDANVKFVFAHDPPHSGKFSADWAQFTVGILIKLTN